MIGVVKPRIKRSVARLFFKYIYLKFFEKSKFGAQRLIFIFVKTSTPISHQLKFEELHGSKNFKQVKSSDPDAASEGNRLIRVQGCQIWPFYGQDTLLKVHKLKFFKLQLRSDSSWSPSKYQNLALSAKFWYFEELQLDIVLRKNQLWQPCSSQINERVMRATDRRTDSAKIVIPFGSVFCLHLKGKKGKWSIPLKTFKAK